MKSGIVEQVNDLAAGWGVGEGQDRVRAFLGLES
jgi:hypothetical protein